MSAVDRARLRARHWKRQPASTAKVIAFPGAATTARPDPFGQITADLVIAQHRTGTLPESSLVALLVAAGLRS
jgi:hypothetical protein